ncbi:acetate/propionate family kinase [Planctellipticum variicoloris]|uniref:acetate/propionate family kinase n=1 Tax=Planctellipticum variicoloris TaxID=3064265 RepID=UPI00301340ED|nr:acetate/propionate family kinase [Planctomycetaceae bacterium SH412]
MKVLVANLGSTSFKYRLFDLSDERQLARGGIDRIGQPQSQCFVEIGGHRAEDTRNVPDHAAAVRLCLEHLMHPEWGCLKSVDEVQGIGFKAVFAGKLSGIRIVDDELLTAMENLSDIAPAHNPPYAKAMRQLRQAFPQIPLVAALETAFHETIPAENRAYAIPWQWQEEYGIQRWGFHGASHRYIGQRIATLLGRDDLRVISCHLGGSNSLCALKGGVSQANTLGMSPQTGLPHNNRVGDFDPFALPVLMRATGKSLPELLVDLANRSGLLGISGLSGDVRDLEQAAATGNARADLALKVFTQSIKQYLGAYLAVLGGADVIVFTGGIGENSIRVRQDSLSGLEWAGIKLDPTLNATVKGEVKLSAADSAVQIWTVPTNEEIVVARQTAEALRQS